MDSFAIDPTAAACGSTPVLTVNPLGSLTINALSTLTSAELDVAGRLTGQGLTTISVGTGADIFLTGRMEGIQASRADVTAPGSVVDCAITGTLTCGGAGTDGVSLRSVDARGTVSLNGLTQVCDLDNAIPMRHLRGLGGTPHLRLWDDDDCQESAKWNMKIEQTSATSNAISSQTADEPFIIENGIIQATGGYVAFVSNSFDLRGTFITTNESIVFGNELALDDGSSFGTLDDTRWLGPTTITGAGAVSIGGRLEPSSTATVTPTTPDIGDWGMSLTGDGSVTLQATSHIVLEMTNMTADEVMYDSVFAPDLTFEDGAFVELLMGDVVPDAFFSGETSVTLISAPVMRGSETGLTVNATTIPADMPCYRFDCVIGVGLVMTVGCSDEESGALTCVLTIPEEPFNPTLLIILGAVALFGLGFLYMVFGLTTKGADSSSPKTSSGGADSYKFIPAGNGPVTPPTPVLRPPQGGPLPTVAGAVPPPQNLISPGEGPMAGAIPIGQMGGSHQGVDPSFGPPMQIGAPTFVPPAASSPAPHMGVDPSFGNVTPASGPSDGPAPHMGVDPAFGNVTPAREINQGPGPPPVPGVPVHPAMMAQGTALPDDGYQYPKRRPSMDNKRPQGPAGDFGDVGGGKRRPSAPPPANLSARRPSQGGGRRPSAGAKGGRGNDFGEVGGAGKRRPSQAGGRRPSQGGGRRPSVGGKGGRDNDFGEVGGKKGRDRSNTGGGAKGTAPASPAGRGRGRGRGRGALPPPGGKAGDDEWSDEEGAPLEKSAAFSSAASKADEIRARKAAQNVFGDADEDPPTERSKGSANSRSKNRRPSAGSRKGSTGKAGGRKGSAGLRKGSVSRAKKVTNPKVPEADL